MIIQQILQTHVLTYNYKIPLPPTLSYFIPFTTTKYCHKQYHTNTQIILFIKNTTLLIDTIFTKILSSKVIINKNNKIVVFY